MSVRGYGEEVSQGGGEEGRELLFREEFEEGGFVVVEGGLEGGEVLHGCAREKEKAAGRGYGRMRWTCT